MPNGLDPVCVFSFIWVTGDEYFLGYANFVDICFSGATTELDYFLFIFFFFLEGGGDFYSQNCFRVCLRYFLGVC